MLYNVHVWGIRPRFSTEAGYALAGSYACRALCFDRVRGIRLLRQSALPEQGRQCEQPGMQREQPHAAGELGHAEFGDRAALGVAGKSSLYMSPSMCARTQDRQPAEGRGSQVQGDGPCTSCDVPVLLDIYTNQTAHICCCMQENLVLPSHTGCP